MKNITDNFKGRDSTLSFWQLMRIPTLHSAAGERLEAAEPAGGDASSIENPGEASQPCCSELCDLEPVTQPLQGSNPSSA